MNTQFLHQDSIPAAPAGIVELSDDFLDELAGSGILGDFVNGIKSAANAAKNVIVKGATAVKNWVVEHTRVIINVPRLPNCGIIGCRPRF
jgi:hypothetical protein